MTEEYTSLDPLFTDSSDNSELVQVNDQYMAAILAPLSGIDEIVAEWKTVVRG